MTTADDLSPFLEIFAARIRRQVEARREQDRLAIQRLELQAALRRYGAEGPNLARACRMDDPSKLEAATRATIAEKVSREARRQARFCRIRDARYDINRHIVVARLMRWLAGDGPWIRQPPGEADPKPVRRETANGRRDPSRASPNAGPSSHATRRHTPSLRRQNRHCPKV
ncbi:hypothetical protein [Jiella mangrovi]|uniref:Uncharacterized protein n=1 Tax=Jiella mangrovi TaxID=2821407 RepID=A0ABS4BFW2_9HYPH|nr:hypothetical protein [Jiella mangrovi]MBP0615645.1 hypothetical protein [Jiella mangrovi]